MASKSENAGPTPERPARAFPVGRCYCGCKAELPDPRGFFVPGHDKRAESQVIRDRYGNVANFLLAHGYGPDGPPAEPGEG